MKFGVREICNVVFRAASTITIGNKRFEKGQPVFYLDSAKTSSMEGSATTVYAQGGRGNTRLVAWEGEKNLTFTVEDALLSPISFAILSGAGVVKGEKKRNEKIHFHQTSIATAGADGIIDLSNALDPTDIIDTTAPLFIMNMDDGGDITDTLKGKFNIVTNPDESLNRKKLKYGDDKQRANFEADYDSTGTGNGKNKAYKFPYIIDSEMHMATRDQVQGWNNALTLQIDDEPAETTGGYPIFAQPVPSDLIETTASGTSYLPDEIWTVSDYQGSSLSIDMPKQLKSPTFTVEDITASHSNTTGYSETVFLVDNGGAKITGGTYKILTSTDIQNWNKDSNHENNQLSEGNVITKQAFNSDNIGKRLQHVYVQNGASTPQKVTLTPKGKLQILANYFGKTMTFMKTKEIDPDTGKSAARTAAEKRYETAQKNTDAYEAFESVANKSVMVDYYVVKNSANVTELQIDATNFGGYYYVEADTLFRRQIDGKDLPANLTFPNVKIQSNFTFSMAATGDPSTFTFTMDAFPGYTYFDGSRKVLCAIQIVDDATSGFDYRKTVFPHVTESDMSTEISKLDSSPDVYDEVHHFYGGTVQG